MRFNELRRLTILFLIAVPVANASESCFQSPETLIDPSIFQTPLTAAMTENMQTFCDTSNLEGVGAMNLGATPTEMEAVSKDDGKLADFFKQRLKIVGPCSWAYSWLPSEKLRQDAYTYDLQTYVQMSMSDVQKVLEKKPAPLKKDDIDDINGGIDQVFDQPSQDISALDTPTNRTLACAIVSMRSAFKCEHGLERVKEIMAQHEDYTLPEENKQILTQEKYREGLRLAALKIKSRVDAGGKPSGDLFGDIKSSFIAAGSSADQAEDNDVDNHRRYFHRGPQLPDLRQVVRLLGFQSANKSRSLYHRGFHPPA
jgi:hypothetical protein